MHPELPNALVELELAQMCQFGSVVCSTLGGAKGSRTFVNWFTR